MRYSLVALTLAVLPAGAVAQEQAPEGVWTFFEESGQIGAITESERGSLILKCDKPGRQEVYAMLLTGSDRLAVPSQRPMARPISFSFDGRGRSSENWRLYEKYATALGKTGDRSLARFVVGLRNASKVSMIVDTGIGADVNFEFDVTGAGAMIPRVYELCKDSVPR